MDKETKEQIISPDNRFFKEDINFIIERGLLMYLKMTVSTKDFELTTIGNYNLDIDESTDTESANEVWFNDDFLAINYYYFGKIYTLL